MATIEDLKQLSIIGVAESLGMELERTGSHTYSWKEHDSFVLNESENYFNWFSRSQGGDVIKMVQVIQEERTGQPVSFKQAKHYLEEGTFEVVDLQQEVEKEPFHYYLEPYETDFKEAQAYLENERQLSKETIDTFRSQGVLAQATKKSGDIFEPVIVFKSLDHQNEVVGASLQGIKENHELYQRGRLKQIMRASDGMTGMHIDIGQPNRLVFAEAPIDLMSYYELHKDSLSDVRLVAMDGLKESTVSRHVADLLFERGALSQAVEEKHYPTFLAHTSQVTDVLKDEKYQDLITIAVDNDEAGRNFIERLESKEIHLISDLPPLPETAEKMDWNDYLKEQKEKAQDLSPEAIKKERTSQYKGSLQPEAEGSTSPVLDKTSTFERSVTSRPTISSQQLKFTIEDGLKSRKTRVDHSINQYELDKLNRRGFDIQESAQFYINELANSKISYFTNEGNVVQVNFSEANFMHLTGLKIIADNQPPEKTLHDFANGGELIYKDIRLGNNDSPLDKIKVLPDLESVLQTDSFYFDQLQDIPRYGGRFDSLIKADDKDIMLLFRSTEENGIVPVSIFKVRPVHNKELEEAQKNIILGIFRERDGKIEQVAINEQYVKDNGKEMLQSLTEIQKGEETMTDFEIENQQLHQADRDFREAKEDEEKSLSEAQKEDQERDSDGDGIPDQVERDMGTNPYSADSDGDGKSDHEEESFGSNPLEKDPGQSESIEEKEITKSVSELIQAKDSKGLSKVLTEGVKAYFNSDLYKNYLEAMSKFHAYSPRNIQLILAQNPNASLIASFKKWKDDFERNVNKGSKSLRIFAPITVKEKDPETGEVLLDKEGKERTKTYFKLVPVFDISQTNGKELAKPIYELEGTYQDYGNLYKSAREVCHSNGVSISFIDKFASGAQGGYSRLDNSIALLKGMSEQQTLKTLFHEMAHSELHTLEKLNENPLKRSTRELQAESVAFVVASHYGLNTSDYSFGYLASWSQDKEGLSDLEGQIKIVQKEANSLITKIDTVLEKYQSKEITKDAFQQKLDRLKNKEPEKVTKLEEKEKAKESSKKEKKSDNEMSL